MPASQRTAPGRLRRLLAARPAQAAIVLILVVAYVLIYLPLRARVGSAAGLLIVLPMVLAGWFFGKPGGVLIGLILPLLNTLLLTLAGQPGWTLIFSDTGGLGPLSAVVVGVVVGHWSDLARALRRQVVEHRQAREALREAAERFERLVDASTEGIAILGGEKVLDANPALAAMFGCSLDDLRGQAAAAFIAPEWREPATQHLLSANPRRLEVVGLKRDGTQFPLALAGRAIRFEGRTALVAIIHDLTERRQAEAALRESRQRFESAFRDASIGMALVAPDGRWLQVNPSVCGLMGYTEAELLATNFQALTHPDDLEADLAYVRQMLAGAIPTYQLEKRYFHKRGHVIWALLSVSLVRDGAGRPQYFLSQIQDISERKQVELALRDSEARYRDLFEESSVSLWEEDFSAVKQQLDGLRRQGVHDLRGYLESHPEFVAECARLVRVSDVNQATLKLYRSHTKSELLQNLDQVFTEESLPAFERELLAIAEGKTEFESESINQTLAGDRLVVSVRWSVVRGYEDSLGKVIISLTDITERKRAEAQLQHAAYHDALTGLPNRALFLDRLSQALERGKRRKDFAFAVLFMDFDRFKVVNDSLGHLAGDELLMAGAQRLSACVRTLDTVARLGGDEFTILLEDVQGLPAVLSVVERIQHALQQPFEVSGHPVVISASIGIVLSSEASSRPEDILRDADAAMYRAKAQGQARYEVFTPEMRTEAVARLKLETDLRRALEQQEFRVYYQPIVALDSGRPLGLEALVRWQHPELGLLGPASFLAAAEETGLIIPIGYWLLREACRQLRLWQRHVTPTPSLTVSVNLSSKQVVQPELEGVVQALLDEYQLDPRSLHLEITEHAIIDDTQGAAGALARLKALGVRLEIDDFGTGYSGLSYLQRLHWDALKIDRTFIRSLGPEGGNNAVVRTILALGLSLQLQVIAEGIETEEQLARLRALGCPYGQGYLFGRPMPAAEAERFLLASGQGAVVAARG